MSDSIRFYKVKDQYGCFSNFSRHGFTLKGKKWKTNEHYFQAQKFVGTKYEEEVSLAKTPFDAAKIGRDRDKPIRNDWEEVKVEIMKEGVMKKFQEHSDIKNILLSTGDKEIIENTTNDYYWGCGNDGSGKNMLGKILMEVRSILKEN